MWFWSFLQLLTSVALLVITGIYVFLTWMMTRSSNHQLVQMIQANEVSRREEIAARRPVLVFYLEGEGYVRFWYAPRLESDASLM